MIYPTRNAIILTAAGAPVALLIGLWRPGLWVAGAAWILFAFGLAFVDAILSASRSTLDVVVTAPGSIPTGGKGEARFRAVFDGWRRPRTVEAALETDQGKLIVTPARGIARVGGKAAESGFELEPRRRGLAPLSVLWLRWRGPFGLIWKQTTEKLDKKIAITPNVAAVKDEAIRMYSRDAAFGQRVQIERGEGSEFQALREFQTGMDPRAIDWKQTARHGKLLAKEFRTERNHPIVFALDTGRLMCEPLAGLPRVDHALNGALILAYVALKTGDRVGFFAFDAKPRLVTGSVSGVGAFPMLQRLAASIDYSAEETNFTLGLTQLSGALERRSLIVVFTDFADTTSAQLMIENVSRLLKTHLVLFVVFRDEELEGMIQAEPLTPDDVSRAVIADALMRERDLVIARLKRMGVEVLDTPVKNLGPDLLSRYLDLKRKDRL
ncbi:MAG TPA: DUF58 domain-containing protein [Caulobacteraceae bacterium]|jgi:uncharacterized protein (DUF58 family)|nr:DUF58 domain-containing protein [Caulobacteraceae bacterium]